MLNFGDGLTWELGVLECYNGFSHDTEGEFLPCDFLNPVYVKEATKRKNPYAPQMIPKDTASEWLYNSSSFVYAPVGVLQSEMNNGRRVPIPFDEAKRRWWAIANKSMKVTPTKSASFNPTEFVSEFRLYKEEYIDFVNENKPNASHKFQVKNKGRIGMFFPIVPVTETQEHVYTWSTVNDNSIGWGLVSPIGEKLDANLQSKEFQRPTREDW